MFSPPAAGEIHNVQNIQKIPENRVFKKGGIVTVWSTTQSAEYSRDFDDDEEDFREEPPCREKSPRDISKCPPKLPTRSLLDDSDTLIILALIMLLMREKADTKLIFALLLVIL